VTLYHDAWCCIVQVFIVHCVQCLCVCACACVRVYSVRCWGEIGGEMGAEDAATVCRHQRPHTIAASGGG